MKKKQTGIYLTPEIIKKLKIEAAESEISYNQLISIILTKHIKRREKK
jgi:predicted HicB family RNase H-like nuclease